MKFQTFEKKKKSLKLLENPLRKNYKLVTAVDEVSKFREKEKPLKLLANPLRKNYKLIAAVDEVSKF